MRIARVCIKNFCLLPFELTLDIGICQRVLSRAVFAAIELAKNRDWRTLKCLPLSVTVISGYPPLLVQLAMILPTGLPDTFASECHRSSVTALLYACFLR